MKSGFSYRGFLSAGAAFGALIVGFGAQAADGADAVVDEVVVSATRAATPVEQLGDAISVLDAVDENFDFAANGEAMLAIDAGEFLEVDAAFALEAYVDNGPAVFNCGDSALDDAAFEAAVFRTTKLFVEHRLEIGARGIG